MLEGFLILSHIILLVSVLYFIFETKKKDRAQETETLLTFNQTVKDVLSHIVDETKKLYETIGTVQVKHYDALEKMQVKYIESLDETQVKYFDSLEKSSKQNNLLLDKNSKEFLKVFAQVFKKDVQVEVPKVIEADKIENSIENASEPEEIMLTDTPRIPIVEGVKIKFEDQEEIYPMNISPIEDYKKEESINPIEK